MSDLGHEFGNYRTVLNNREHQLVPDMMRVDFVKKERQVIELLDVAGVLTYVVVKVCKALDHSGVV